MSRERELVKNTFIIALGTFLPKLTTLVTLPILTAYLSKTEYGTFDLLTTLVSLVLPVATLKIEAAAFRFLIDCRDSKEKAKEVTSTILTFLVPVSIVVIAILFCVMPVESKATRLLICLYFLLDILYMGIQQIVRGLSRNIIYSISAIIYSVINMGLIVILIASAGKGLDGLLISMLAALAIAIVILVFPTSLIKLYSIKSFSCSRLKEMLSYSWPMIPNSLSAWVMNLSDRLIVTAVMGIEANAVYAVANKIPNLFATLQGTFVFAWQENASIAVGDSDAEDYYSKMFDSIFSLLVGMMAGLIAITPILFMVLIRGEYQDAYYQMPYLFGGMLFSALSAFLGGIYVAHKRTKAVGITTMIAAAMNFLINILFIKLIGLYAASISTFASFMFLSIFRMFDIQKFQKLKYKWVKIVASLVILLVMCVIFYMNITAMNVLNFFVGVAFSIVLNRTILMTILNSFKKKLLH